MQQNVICANMESKSKQIPLHLIGGPLGVGKTTAIRRFVAQTRDYVAVLVNDFGETGYDAAFIEDAGGDGVRVENVPGGCLCCTSAAQMLPALKRLCENPDVDRIIVEPSGIALLNPLLKMLRAASEECGFELMPVIVLFDPEKIRPAAIELIPYWKHLMDHADIVVANRCDLASDGIVQAFFQWLEKLDPSKLKTVQTSHGELAQDLFDLCGQTTRILTEGVVHSDLPPAGTFRSDQLFGLKSLLDFLETVASQVVRFKGVFNTDAGWIRLEITSGGVEQKPARNASQSSADWIGATDLHEGLQRCAQGA